MIRYDNLKAAVASVLGFSRQRVEADRWTALRSHYGIEAFYSSGRWCPLRTLRRTAASMTATGVHGRSSPHPLMDQHCSSDGAGAEVEADAQ
jgi:hypothetical protein